MCLAVPAQAVEVHEDQAVVEFRGNRLRISTALTPDLRLGGWVLVHAGFAISKIDPADLSESFAGVDGDEGAMQSESQ